MIKHRFATAFRFLWFTVVILSSASLAAEFNMNRNLVVHSKSPVGKELQPTVPLETCAGDFDWDRDNDGVDLEKMIRGFGDPACCETDPQNCFGDFQCDDVVDTSDLTVFVGGFGLERCSSPIQLTYFPQYPNTNEENLRGIVNGIDPEDYFVVVYIRVEDVWWIKPTLDDPKTTILPNGTWTCDITTGGNDAYATDIAVYLFHKNCPPAGIGVYRNICSLEIIRCRLRPGSFACH